MRTTSDTRNGLVLAVSKTIVRATFPIIYGINLQGSFPEGNALFLPRHQSNHDPLLHSYLILRHYGESPHVIMKSSLPWALEMIGGIPIMRPKDLRKNRNKEKARSMNSSAIEKSRDLLREGHSAVIYPEGTRSEGQVGNIRENNMAVSIAQSYFQKYGESPLIVPVGTKYSKSRFGRKSVSVVVGEPLEFNSSFVRNLSKSLEHLSQ